MFYIEYIK